MHPSSPPPGGAALELDAAAFTTAQGVRLVQPVSLSLAAGHRMAIVGPNGAGKSTLLKLMGGLLPASAGEIRLDGMPLHTMHPAQRARSIAVLGQNDQTDGRLQVQDYVALGCLPHRTSWTTERVHAQVERALEQCRLQTLRHQAVSRLSGGERQRAHLARALAQAPRLLLLDEPTNHLDPRATLDLLQGVSTLGITVVAVLHDLALVPQWAEHVVVMQAGAMVTCAPADQALSPPRVHQVFGLHAFYLPHPDTAQPLLVMDTQPPAGPARQRTSFFNHYEEKIPCATL
nr:ABC transporter ATP-binding protein [uncultured Rhodoferax sp.]